MKITIKLAAVATRVRLSFAFFNEAARDRSLSVVLTFLSRHLLSVSGRYHVATAQSERRRNSHIEKVDGVSSNMAVNLRRSLVDHQ